MLICLIRQERASSRPGTRAGTCRLLSRSSFELPPLSACRSDPRHQHSVSPAPLAVFGSGVACVPRGKPRLGESDYGATLTSAGEARRRGRDGRVGRRQENCGDRHPCASRISRSSLVKARILYGNETDYNEYPWQVSEVNTVVIVTLFTWHLRSRCGLTRATSAAAR